MAKKEEVVDLKPKAEKISKEHLEALHKAVNGINRLHFNIGKIESQKFMIMGQLQSAQSAVSGLQELFLNEYGSYDVNLEDGTINWPKEGEEIENEK